MKDECVNDYRTWLPQRGERACMARRNRTDVRSGGWRERVNA